MYGYNTVPLYDTLGDTAIEFIMTQTEMRVVVATYDKAQVLYKLKSKLPLLCIIVVMDEFPASFIEECKLVGVDVIGIYVLEMEGSNTPITAQPSGPEDLATICYTSGTTGVPKGVMLTHRNVLSTAFAVSTAGKHDRFTSIQKDDVHISYLPLAHVFERVIQQFLVMHGAAVGFYQVRVVFPFYII
jgi:long-chain acyl-CoA synthetase